MSQTRVPAATPAAPYRVLATAGRIIAATGRGLSRCWLTLLGLAALAFTLHHWLVDLGARVAVDNGPAGMALLVLAICVRLVLLAVMLLVAARHIQLDGRPLAQLDLAGYITDPQGEHVRESRLRDQVEAFLAALVPLALLYAGWEFVNQDIHQFLFRIFWGYSGAGEHNNSNIDFREGWKTYIPWTVGAWLLKVLFEKLHQRRGWGALVLPIVYLEVAWIVLAWLVVQSLMKKTQVWGQTRELVHWWREAIGWLGDHVHVGLPDVVARSVAATHDLLSLISLQLVMPMVWVAVAALVLGWGLHESNVVRGSRLEEPADRQWHDASERRRKALDLSTRGLREKYLPVLAVLRLVWRTGLLTILTIAVLYAAGSVLGAWAAEAAMAVANHDGTLGVFAKEAVARLTTFLLGSVTICFLVAAFAEILRLRQARLSA